jgi:GDPmannose 4,6-dehydratase
MPKRALICGISGQDGGYLSRLLLNKGYEIWGTSRDAEMAQFTNLRRLGIFDSVQLVSLNLRDTGGILSLLRSVRPDQVYSLAGQSSVGLSFEQPVETIESIALHTLNLLEAIRLSDRDIRLYNAGSTECFGDTGEGVANEHSPFNPCSPYAVAKASAYWIVSNYRQAYRLFACTGILSNHDSPLRPRRFVTRKIIRAVAELSQGGETRLHLGNLQIERDWGWAPDYIDAIWRMMEQPVPSDYVIATGQSYPLVDFVRTAFELIGRDWREFVTVDERLMRPSEITHNKVNPSKAAMDLKWRAQFKMPDVVRSMLENELAMIRGETDAI